MRKPRGIALALALLLAPVLPRAGEAREAYARKEELRCGACHMRDDGRAPLNCYGRSYRQWGACLPFDESRLAVRGGGARLTPAQRRILYRKYLKLGKRIFHYDGLGEKRTACADCHSLSPVGTARDAKMTLGGAFQRYPRYRWEARGIVTIEHAINMCVVDRMDGRPLRLGSPSVVALLTFLKAR